MRQLLISADDFGLSPSVNEGIERAHRDGILTTASLMVAGAAVADAVERARRMPDLKVGLHLVVIEGPAVLDPVEIPLLVDRQGRFPSDQIKLGLRYFFRPDIRRQLACEVQAQFDAFARTGLALDHANAHKHMHLHPTVGAMMVRAGLRHGLKSIRVPIEPPVPVGEPDTIGARALRAWTRVLRAQLRRAGMTTNDACFGLAWSGHMTTDRLITLAGRLPEGFSEIYFHPAASRDPLLDALMPGYEHEAELAALCDPRVRRALFRTGAVPATWQDAR
ncbi:hopanoid biosynthesis-associated protein HpnK [Lichenicola cladoniae]|uniref:Hopanoid biosynthesis-associated protein HpnK n=1 Tax=Lichenicola cladoniae TaxID=1484109 RepID=A0A6M8H6I6_9PROT|nr:hopanoid biosynthesis-associated protein HpnK [Lichenicola cladoniae]NPD68511.1 hopanoid biosynthesis-associated protein HpnK [Acetobacteraceae bacterium]QKE89001.1 hopanoid biosynthesis-associated protein HpnK [Lichenicola cladoniae]